MSSLDIYCPSNSSSIQMTRPWWNGVSLSSFEKISPLRWLSYLEIENKSVNPLKIYRSHWSYCELIFDDCLKNSDSKSTWTNTDGFPVHGLAFNFCICANQESLKNDIMWVKFLHDILNFFGIIDSKDVLPK